MSWEMAVSVLVFSFASLRSKSRLRSQLGFFAWIFDRFYGAPKRRRMGVESQLVCRSCS